MRRRPLLVLALALGGAGVFAGYGAGWIDPGIDAPPPPAGAPAGEGAAGLSERARELALARRSYDPARVDAFLTEQLARAEATPEDAAEWRLLAEAHLERSYLRDRDRGLLIGAATHAELPEGHVADLDAAEAALARARAAGDDSSEWHRLRAAVLSARITGLASALRHQAEATRELERALELDPANARARIALGARLLFAPRMLGHDPERALPEFLFGAEALPLDERPLVFAALAQWELGRTDEARALLARAVERNPENRYARVVLERIEAGEEEPFARDL